MDMSRLWTAINIYICLIFPITKPHALKSVIFRHWLESLFMFSLLFRPPYHFSIQMLMFLSHTVPGYSSFLSSLIFPCRIASPVVLVTWTNHPNFHLHTAYVGSWDPITSADSSLMALLVLFTVFSICVILQRHLNSKIQIPYSAAVVLAEDYWEHNHSQKSCLHLLEMLLSFQILAEWDLSSWEWFHLSISTLRF